jgi:hypothetical protein
LENAEQDGVATKTWRKEGIAVIESQMNDYGRKMKPVTHHPSASVKKKRKMSSWLTYSILIFFVPYYIYVYNESKGRRWDIESEYFKYILMIFKMT